MNVIDKRYLEKYKEILESGSSDSDEDVRARWSDGSKAYTRSIFGSVERYDLSKGFPILSIRKINWKVALDEILWIWQKKSNKVKDLNSKIWNSWANYKDCDGDDTIGKAYGYQLGKKYNFPEGKMDQVDRVLYLLKNNKSSRRIVTNIFNHEDLNEMGLQPCAYGTNISVKDGRINMLLIQRSGDFLTAAGPGSFNVVQYALLLHILGKVSGLEVGELLHLVTDLHIYDRHIDQLVKLEKEVEESEILEPLPKLKIVDKESFYDYKVEDFTLEGYNPRKSIGKIEVAI